MIPIHPTTEEQRYQLALKWFAKATRFYCGNFIVADFPKDPEYLRRILRSYGMTARWQTNLGYGCVIIGFRTGTARTLWEPIFKTIHNLRA